MLDSRIRETCIEILKEELLCATGCTEPIAVAYCAARMREILGAVQERILAEVSGNILENVKSVIVPNTGGQRGIRAAVAAGVTVGKADRGLEVIAEVPKEQYPAIVSYMKTVDLQVVCPDTPRMLDIRLTGWKDDKKAVVHIANSHTNIVYMEADRPGDTGHHEQQQLNVNKTRMIRVSKGFLSPTVK